MSIDDVVKHIEPAHEVPPRSRELLEEILATPRERGRARGQGRTRGRGRTRLRRRPRYAVPLVASLAAAIVLLGWLLPGGLGPRPAAALDIRKEGGYYTITVKDAFADRERYETELKRRGIDIALEVQPVSPGLVGQIFTPYDSRRVGLSPAEEARRADLIAPIERPGACAGRDTCTIGIKIPVGYRPYTGPDWRGPAVISLGRAGRPGERFSGFGQLDNYGEPLQCQSFVNKTVAEVQAMLRARGVTVGRFAVPLKGPRTSAPGSWYVHEGWLTEPGKALLVADATPVKRPAYPHSRQCPKGS